MAAGNRAAARGDDDLVTAAPPPREVFEYDIPEEMHALGVSTTKTFGRVNTVGLYLLTPLEEKNSATRAKGDPMSLAFELALGSLAELNGKRLQMHDGSKDTAWFELHPQIRNLITQAYSEMSVASDKATTAFLKSRKIKVV